jgi:hypothetical protein
MGLFGVRIELDEHQTGNSEDDPRAMLKLRLAVVEMPGTSAWHERSD